MKLTQRTETVVLYQGDDLARLEELAEQIEGVASDDGPQTLDGAGDYNQLVAEHDELLAAAEERAIRLALAPVGRRKFRDLVEGNPPREGNKGDQLVGVNEDGLAEALVPVSITAPEMSDAERDELLDSLTHAQFERLYSVAFALNRSLGADPKAMTPSTTSPSGGATQS